jgi:hypothetical protein
MDLVVFCISVRDMIAKYTPLISQVINFSIEDETGNVKQITSPETGNSMGKIVMDTSGNVYSPDRESNCVYKLSSDLKLNQIITDSEFYDIHAICSNKNCSKLFVANNRGESIIVFNCT